MQYLTGSATQGSANAFVQSEVATALTGAGNVAFRIRELLFEFPTAGILPGDSDEIQVCLTRRSKSAMPVITDRDVIAKYSIGVSGATSGFFAALGVVRFAFSEDDELLIVEDPVYFQVDSNSLAGAQTAYVRIGYERTTISAVDRLTLLTQSLE